MSATVEALILANKQERGLLKARVRDLDVEIRLLWDQQRSSTRAKLRAELKSSTLVEIVEVGEGHGEGCSSCTASERSAHQGEDQVRTEGHYPERREGQAWQREATCLGRPVFGLHLPCCWEEWRPQS